MVLVKIDTDFSSWFLSTYSVRRVSAQQEMMVNEVKDMFPQEQTHRRMECPHVTLTLEREPPVQVKRRTTGV